MNKVFESESMVVHDDREFIEAAEAISILLKGGSVMLCDLPDYSAENDWDIHNHPFEVRLSDIIDAEEQNKIEEAQQRIRIYNYIRSYEISR